MPLTQVGGGKPVDSSPISSCMNKPTELLHLPLIEEDLGRVIGRLPKAYATQLKLGRGILAGGFIRSVLAGEEVKDIDIYCSPAMKVNWGMCKKVISATPFPFGQTIRHEGVSVPLQVITGIDHSTPADLLATFDFTICKAVVWYDVAGKSWRSLCDVKFYLDLATKRLRYEAPKEHKYAGASLLRMRKFIKRGYHIPASSLAQMVVDLLGVDILEEKEYDKRLTLLCTKLVELDPSEGGPL